MKGGGRGMIRGKGMLHHQANAASMTDCSSHILKAAVDPADGAVRLPREAQVLGLVVLPDEVHHSVRVADGSAHALFVRRAAKQHPTYAHTTGPKMNYRQLFMHTRRVFWKKTNKQTFHVDQKTHVRTSGHKGELDRGTLGFAP